MSRLKWMAVYILYIWNKKSYYFVSNVKKSSVEFNFKTGKLLKWYVVKNSKVYTISICHMPSLKETSKPHYNSLKEEENSRIKFFSLSQFLGDLFFSSTLNWKWWWKPSSISISLLYFETLYHPLERKKVLSKIILLLF